MAKTVTATGYLVIQSGSGSKGRFVKATSRVPDLSGPQVAVRLNITLPESVFWAAVAEVDVDVPEGAAILPEVTVVTPEVIG